MPGIERRFSLSPKNQTCHSVAARDTIIFATHEADKTKEAGN
jgi:hypothetical protein